MVSNSMISYRLCRASTIEKGKRTTIFHDRSLERVRAKRSKVTKFETGIYMIGRDMLWKFVEGVDVTKLDATPNDSGEQNDPLKV